MIRIISYIFGLAVLGALAGGAIVLYVIHEYGMDLPEHDQLARYEPPTVTRVHAGDGRLLAEYATEKRVFVPIQAIPKRVVHAFLAAEDKNFYGHRGVDTRAVLRAVLVNIRNLRKNRRPVGASTITQQVAKNFLLTNEVSIERKVKEAILAFRIERAFEKDRILELYLNEIYLGFGSYGVAAAALNYFNKSLDELSIAEAAYLAALPKAPNNYHPIHRPDAAVARRDWVIGRMVEDGRITEADAAQARAAGLEIRSRDETEVVTAEYFAEEVRRALIRLYGEDGLYQGGLSVRTTLNPMLQEVADRVLREGLLDYDRRHGWRGPLGTLDLSGGDWKAALTERGPEIGIEPWQLAVVLEAGEKSAVIGLADGTNGEIPMREMTWARTWIEGQKVGKTPARASDVLSAGDLIAVEPVTEDVAGAAYPEGSYALRQIPDVDGGLVAIDPHTGRVLAMAGGFSYRRSEFNRVTQARRQPGSAFKPIVYLAALDSGFTPVTRVLDAPFVIDQGAGLGKWKPSNFSNKFHGPTPMRIGIEQSRNLMTVRLAQTVGMEKIIDYTRRFGIVDNMPPLLSMSLGSAETTLLRMTTAYAMLVNGGKQVTPTLIDRVQDRHGRTVFRHDARDCPGCEGENGQRSRVPALPDEREQIADPRSVYQIVSMLQGVVQRGTGRRIAEIGKPLAGKTGTTNDSFDTWFVGFSPDLAVGVFIGFDEPKTMGPKEGGSSVSAPVFKAFMTEALADRPATPFRIPPGVRLVRVNAETGRLAQLGDKKVILEAFLPDTVPSLNEDPTLDGGYAPSVGEIRGAGGGNGNGAVGVGTAGAAPAANVGGGIY